MYQSKYYTCEEIDERLLKGYYDDAVSKGYTGTFEQLQLELASVDLIDLNLLNSNAGYTLTEAVAKMDELSPVHPPIVRFRYTDKTYNKLRTLTYDSTKSTLLTKVTDISTYTLTLSEFNGDIFKSLLLEIGQIGFEGSMNITHSGTICGKVSIFGDTMGHVVNQEVLTNCVLSSDRTSLESSNNHTKIFKYERFFNLSNSSFQDRDGNIVLSHDNSLWYTSTTVMAESVVGNPAGDWNKGTAEAYIDKEIAKVKNWVSNTPVTNVVVVETLPASGKANTLYRVKGTNAYSEYGWDGSKFVLLAVKDYGIDDVPTADSDNLVKSGGVAKAVDEVNYDLLSSNKLSISTIQKTSNRVYTRIFKKGDITGILLPNDSIYELILGVGDDKNLSDEVFVNDWSDSIDLDYVNKRYWRITVRIKDNHDGSFFAKNVKILTEAYNINSQTSAYKELTSDVNMLMTVIEGTDFSNYEITHGYIFDNGKSFSESLTCDCTGFIPVKEGDSFIYSGFHGSTTDLNAIAGYTAEDMSTGINLLSATGLEMHDIKVKIPANINYIRAWSRNSEHTTTPSRLVLHNTTNAYTPYSEYTGLSNQVENNSKELEIIKDLINKVSTDNVNILVKEGDTVLLTGASFATANGTDSGWDAEINGYNRWFEEACKNKNLVGINHAIGGQSIIHTANMMKDYSGEKPHGTLFMHNGVDVFDDVVCFVIMQVHNQNVLYTGTKNIIDYETNGINGYAEGFDYVIKKYKQWCLACKDDVNSKHYGSQYGKPCQILLCTHWHDARTIFNNSVRLLSMKSGCSLCRFDDKIGFSKDFPNPNGNQESIYHCWNPAAPVGTGAKEEINGVIYGWHLQKPKYMSVDEYELPYIQKKMASILEECFSK